MSEIVPSLLSADFAILAEEVADMKEAGAERLHLDVMDGHFVPNLSFGNPVVKSLRSRSDLHFEVHLMVQNPGDRIDEFLKAGADTLIFHIEADGDASELIKRIKAGGIEAGISIKPETPLSSILELIPEIDLLLVMTVDPGFGGQAMIKSALNKVIDVKRMNETGNLLVEVDGGINLETIQEAAEVGTDLIVSGSTIFHSSDPSEMFKTLTRKANLNSEEG
ncbi:ribulose-phosphate 3-epimerase [Candidatus Marinimicrobia bacterium MT.SAG.3]|nr:ribulose-phosphate 3-epimerase [Candidatus Marinimicrobia bacterium MT.SAG.3]